MPKNLKSTRKSENQSNNQEDKVIKKRMSEKIENIMGKNVTYFIFSLIVSSSYFISLMFICNDMSSFFLRACISLFITLFCLLALSSPFKSGRSAAPIVLFIFAIFFLTLILHYSKGWFPNPGQVSKIEIVDESNKKNKDEIEDVQKEADNDEVKKSKDIVLSLGINTFSLKKSEESEWIRFPEDGDFTYSVNSSNEEKFSITFEGGESYYGWEDIKISNKHNPRFKLTSFDGKEITVNVKEKN